MRCDELLVGEIRRWRVLGELRYLFDKIVDHSREGKKLR
jgi:uncharacterized Fe-S cluster-containing protein